MTILRGMNCIKKAKHLNKTNDASKSKRTNEQANRQTDKKTNTQTDKKTNRQTDKQKTRVISATKDRSTHRCYAPVKRLLSANGAPQKYSNYNGWNTTFLTIASGATSPDASARGHAWMGAGFK